MLRALDSNIILRAVLNDDPRQSPRARSILADQALLLTTVALESFWVLTVPKRISQADAANILTKLIQMPNMIVPDRDALQFALTKAAEGADFADMLHLALSGGADVFTTFDQGIAPFADGAPVPVELLQG
ncbi:type II toxin-antitoxin system VapC family toxin [Sandarakinorhabdus sp.]|uniref:type II toxin-antitoxin system VapC family toxin n=1 Tax=Sandarakinorhabdus sp. TaxID=1916663 RepID=UPI003F6F16FE